MKKRIIGNHTIKVFVTREDLKQHGITALDLLGDHNQIENFFYKILDEVDTNHLFTNHEPLTFRIMPNKLGLDIIISNRSKAMIIKGHKPLTSKKSFHSKNDNVIRLDRFEDFVQIAHLLKLRQGDSTLYRYHNHYYLELSFNSNLIKFQRDAIKDKLSIAYEYGRKASVSPSFLKDNGQVIMKSHALELGRYYFR